MTKQERARREAEADLLEALSALASRLRVNYDTRPLTKEEWDAAFGDKG